ncbi:MAG: MFS transporter [Planctomycetes bacterium]|nr:MFS transporter [Planctomycetota bacterium]
MRPPAPLSRAGRAAVLASAFAGLVFGGIQLGLMPLLSLSVSRDLMGPAYTEGLAGEWFARYTASIMLGAAFGGILLGGLGDRIGRTRAMGASILCYSIFGGAGGLVTSQGQLVALRFLAGIGVGGMWPNGVALVSECWPGATRPLVAGVVGTGINIGILCVSQLGRLRQVTPESWRWMLEASAVSIALGAIALRFIPESPRWLAARGAGEATAKPAAPRRELFRPPLLRRTLVGIALGAIPLIGAWAASKWMIPWADAVGGTERPGYKAVVQGWWAVGAILGSFSGAQLASLLGRRRAYFLISLGSTVLTCGIFLLFRPLDRAFLPLVFVQGFVSTLFFGWLPLYLPELFPTRVRAAGSGIAYNSGRFISAAGILAAGTLMAWSGGDYPRVGAICGLVYALGMIVIWWAPDTANEELQD